MVHTGSPSYSGDWGDRIAWTWEAEAGEEESLEPRRWRLQSAKITPLHSSLGDRVTLHHKKQTNKQTNKQKPLQRLHLGYYECVTRQPDLKQGCIWKSGGGFKAKNTHAAFKELKWLKSQEEKRERPILNLYSSLEKAAATKGFQLPSTTVSVEIRQEYLYIAMVHSDKVVLSNTLCGNG